MKCLRCDAQMEHMSDEEIQLGHQSLLFGDLPNLLSGSLEVSIYVCPQCGKMEFFNLEEDSMPLSQILKDRE